jgi:hypothetical protein
VGCSSGWLPDGTVTYYECKEGPNSLKRSGSIVCNGFVKVVNNSAENYYENTPSLLPCGIRNKLISSSCS